MRHTRKHRGVHRGGSSEMEGSLSNVSNEVDNMPAAVEDLENALQTGGRRSRGRRSRGRHSRSTRRSRGGSRKSGGRRKGGRRSRRGGFMTGVGAVLKEAVVPLGLLYGATRNKKNRVRRGGDVA